MFDLNEIEIYIYGYKEKRSFVVFCCKPGVVGTLVVIYKMTSFVTVNTLNKICIG